MKTSIRFAVSLVLGVCFTLIAARESAAEPVLWSIESGGNGHYYEIVSGNISWTDALAEAEDRVLFGVHGHLATLTSFEEKEFVRLQVGIIKGWLGGFQDTNADDYSEPAGGWRWITGEPWGFTNWANAEPNEFNPGENYVDIGPAADSPDGFGWNDQNVTEVFNTGYYVEYPVPEPASGAIALAAAVLLAIRQLVRRRQPVA